MPARSSGAGGFFGQSVYSLLSLGRQYRRVKDQNHEDRTHLGWLASHFPSSSSCHDLGRRAPQYTSVQRLPEPVTLATLSNGLTVIVQENHVAPVATVRCFVKNTGSAYEGKNLGAGLSHVLEHVVAGGSTTHRTEKEIEKIIDSFGGATNAFTSNDMTTFFIDCPAKNTHDGHRAVGRRDAARQVRADRVRPGDEGRPPRAGRRRGRAPARALEAAARRRSTRSHPARYPVIGYLEVLNRTTNQTIIDFYHERYVPNNQVFVVVGDVDTQHVLDAVAKQYAGTPRAARPTWRSKTSREQLSPREAVREMEGAAYDMVFAWPTVKLSNPDLYALDVAAYILGEGESSRLVQRLKYQQQLVLSVGAESDTPHYVAGMFAVMAASRPETWQKAAEDILREVYRLRDELVGPEELAKAKKQKAAELVFGRQTVKQAADGAGPQLRDHRRSAVRQGVCRGHPKGDGRAGPRRGPAVFRAASGSIG